MGKKEGLEGEEMRDYMAKNAAMNAVMGLPITAISGRTGAREARKAISESASDAFNKTVKLTKDEGLELKDLLVKAKKTDLTPQETSRLTELRNKATAGTTVTSKGKIVAKSADDVDNIMTKADNAVETSTVKAETPTVKETTAIKAETQAANNGTNIKAKQLEVINKSNPMEDSYHTGIREESDIKTFKEAIEDSDAGFTPDYTAEMASKALNDGEITVYSSKPIEDGAFVSPSKMIAKDYAGGGKVYEQKVSVDDVAWIDATEGQIAKIADIHADVNKGRNKSNMSFKERVLRKASTISESEVLRSRIKPSKLSDPEKEIANEYIKAVDRPTMAFVKEIKSLKDKSIVGKFNHEICTVSKREASDILRITGINVEGRTHNINGSTVMHIEKRHGINGQADNTMSEDADIARMGYVLKNYDTVDKLAVSELDDSTFQLSKAWQNSRKGDETSNELADVIRYEKKVDGTYYVVQAVQDANTNRLQIISAYMSNKNSNTMTGTLDKTVQHLTSETVVTSVANPKIAQDGVEVNLVGRKSTSGGGKSTESVSPKEVVERAQKLPTKEEVNATAIRAMKEVEESYGGSSEMMQTMVDGMDKGFFSKLKGESRDNAIKRANSELENLGYEEMKNQFVRSPITEDPKMVAARAQTLYNEIDRMIKAGIGDERQLRLDKVDVVSRLSATSNFGGRATQAMKDFLTATPEGKIRTVNKEIEKLQKKYASVLKGKEIEVDQAKLEKLATAEGAEKEEILDDINRDIWSQIPVSLFEKMNEIRHCFMLFNVKTHGRNIIGNSVFRAVRFMSDELEAAILKNKKVKAKIESKGGTIDKVHVDFKEVSENKDFLNDEFNAIYSTSGSKNRYKEIEANRPEDMPVTGNKLMDKLIQINYAALEKEDLKGALKPAFDKAYVSWCKARCPKDMNLADFMKNMSDSNKKKARHYALTQGEYATFRDTCAFSSWLTGKKQKFATMKGKSMWGTLGYRALDVALEGVIPFVKTPVNVFLRSVDYSPVSLFKAMGDLARADSAETVKRGIHELATGLTGTGVAGLGFFLSYQGFVTVKAGEESGDAYYDRDMGYQDYSIQITPPFGNPDDKTWSWTIDWASPTQMSFFLGAALQKGFDKKGFTGQDGMNLLFSLTAPMTDTSFMSSAKDTAMMFMERATRGSEEKETDFGGATVQLLLGDIPKNYISSFVPQLVAQTAGFTDKYQRDTRSTVENEFLRGWDSSLKQLVNKVPGFRQLLLNPKLDRKGNEKKNGENIATRLVNSYFNPANVKEITEDKTDRELIQIRNHMDKDSDDYKYFFYNFTGNPSYNLANGKRMTYDEAYTYGKANRVKQNELIETMINSKSYKNMTWGMKADEVDDAHWIGTAVADLKTYGANYAIKSLTKSEYNKKEKETWQEYKRLNGAGEATNKAYMNYYINKETLRARSHADGDDMYRVKAITAILSGDDNLLSALDIHKKKVDDLKKYKKTLEKNGFKGNKLKEKAFQELSDACCEIMSNVNKAEVSSASKGVKSVSAGIVAANGNQIAERVYRALGHNWNSAQAGGGLMLKYNKDDKYSVKRIMQMKSELRTQFDTNDSGSINKSEVIEYIDSLGIKSDDEKACLYEVLYSGGNYKNPYKSQIDDHLKWGKNRDTDSSSGSGGYGGYGRRYGRRGRSGGSGGSGGSSKGTMPKTESGAIDGKVTNPFKNSDVTKPSNLDDAYRKKLKKLREETRK